MDGQDWTPREKRLMATAVQVALQNPGVATNTVGRWEREADEAERKIPDSAAADVYAPGVLSTVSAAGNLHPTSFTLAQVRELAACAANQFPSPRIMDALRPFLPLLDARDDGR